METGRPGTRKVGASQGLVGAAGRERIRSSMPPPPAGSRSAAWQPASGEGHQPASTPRWNAATAPEASTAAPAEASNARRSEEHTSELQSRQYLVCRLLLEKKKKNTY